MLTKRVVQIPRPAKLSGREDVASLKEDVETLSKQVEYLGKALSDFIGGLNAAGALYITQTVLDTCTLENTAIGGTTPAAGTFTNLTVNGNTVIGDASGDSITYKSAAWTFTNSPTVTGTWANLGSVTTCDINGGTIDGSTIGGASAAAGTFTDATATNFYGGYARMEAPSGTAIGIDIKARASDNAAALRFTNNAFSAAQGHIWSFSSGSLYFDTGATALNYQFVVVHTASAVNYVAVTGAATGGDPAVVAVGSDTNVDLIIGGQGTGLVRLANSAAAASVPANFAANYRLAIKDGAGNTYYIPCDNATW